MVLAGILRVFEFLISRNFKIIMIEGKYFKNFLVFLWAIYKLRIIVLLEFAERFIHPCLEKLMLNLKNKTIGKIELTRNIGSYLLCHDFKQIKLLNIHERNEANQKKLFSLFFKFVQVAKSQRKNTSLINWSLFFRIKHF